MKTTCSLLILMALASPCAADCAPLKVLKIVTVMEMADKPPSEPHTLYRLGDRYGRLEAPDMLFVVNEPDAWVVNRAETAGQHIVDPDKPGKFHAPVLDSVDSKFWRQFEFGCEEPFMKAVGARAEELGDGAIRYTHAAEGNTVSLVVANGKPQRVEVTLPEQQFAIRYLTFEMLQETSTDRFTKPEKIRFVETKPEQ